jgi:hypothetical protein
MCAWTLGIPQAYSAVRVCVQLGKDGGRAGQWPAGCCPDLGAAFCVGTHALHTASCTHCFIYRALPVSLAFLMMHCTSPCTDAVSFVPLPSLPRYRARYQQFATLALCVCEGDSDIFTAAACSLGCIQQT